MPQDQSIPYGFCHCGCGKKTNLADQSLTATGQIRGEPLRYVYGHSRRSKRIRWVPGLCICLDRECDIPRGECHCGCGEKTEISSKTDSRPGWIKGQPQKYVVGHTLRINRTKSIEKQIASRTTHGLRTRIVENPTYVSWAAMKQRCLNPNTKAYIHYGGRGIKVCDRWMAFSNFLNDMGEKPDKSLTIERMNVNGNYEPENCKWATRKEQVQTRRPRGPSRPKIPAWIRVEHKLPEEYKVVAVILYGEVTAGFLSHDMKPRWYICSERGYQTDNVTFWMPLPDPPESVEEEVEHERESSSSFGS